MKQTTAAGLLTLAAGMLLLTACKKEYSNTTPPATAIARFESRSGEDGFISFEYNSNGTIKKAAVANELSPGDTTRYTISYTADKRISEFTNDAGVKFTPVYTNGELTRVQIRTVQNDDLAYTDYEYLNGFLKSVTVFFVSGNQVTPFFKSSFIYDASGNIRRTQLFSADPLSPDGLSADGTVRHVFDNKTNPLYSAKEFLRMILMIPSPNNVSKEEAVDSNNQPERVKEYNYIYNNKELPLSAVLTETVPGKPIQTKSIAYRYQ
jgi:hypothetical protein